jgi:hypothetical protein
LYRIPHTTVALLKVGGISNERKEMDNFVGLGIKFTEIGKYLMN